MALDNKLKTYEKLSQTGYEAQIQNFITSLRKITENVEVTEDDVVNQAILLKEQLKVFLRQYANALLSATAAYALLIAIQKTIEILQDIVNKIRRTLQPIRPIPEKLVDISNALLVAILILKVLPIPNQFTTAGVVVTFGDKLANGKKYAQALVSAAITINAFLSSVEEDSTTEEISQLTLNTSYATELVRLGENASLQQRREAANALIQNIDNPSKENLQQLKATFDNISTDNILRSEEQQEQLLTIEDKQGNIYIVRIHPVLWSSALNKKGLKIATASDNNNIIKYVSNVYASSDPKVFIEDLRIKIDQNILPKTRLQGYFDSYRFDFT